MKKSKLQEQVNHYRGAADYYFTLWLGLLPRIAALTATNQALVEELEANDWKKAETIAELTAVIDRLTEPEPEECCCVSESV